MSEPRRRANNASFFLRARPGQALLETWLLGGLLLVGLLSLHEQLPSNVLSQGVFFLTGGAALWCAVRARLPGYPSRLHRWVQEGLLALLLSLLVTVGWGLGARLVWGDVLSPSSGGLGGPYLFLPASGAEFLVFRVGATLWQAWAGLRQRRLLWALTHMQVQVVLAFSLLYVVVFVVALFLQGYLPSRAESGTGIVSVISSLVLTFLPLLGVSLVGTAVLLAVVLPPTVLFAYRVSRRTTRRLEALADAATKLRAGHYATRVEVQGVDEVAQLQADFNVMASDLEQAVHALGAERDRVTALLQARGELVASVSHELRTPVATMRGYLESSRAHWSAGVPEALSRDLAVIEREVARLQDLIDDLFTLSRAEAGGLSLQLQPTDVGALIRRQVDAMAPLAWQSGRVHVTAETPPGLAPAMADLGRLEQVLVNLLRNGVRYTPPGGIVAVVANTEPAAICIQVRDTGQGIAPEDLPHIWDRFYRGKTGAQARPSGAGLGLALVKELIEAMEGTVAVESAIGQGSCFTLRLPKA
jgi:signal transduction histidine kinase